MIDAIYRMLPSGAKTKAKRILRRLPAPVRKLLSAGRRRAIAMNYYSDKLKFIDKWVWRDTETSNFYYKLTPINRDHLAQMIAGITGDSYKNIIQYFEELECDDDLRAHLKRTLRETDYGRDIEIEFGRRIGWYAFVRTLKPKIVIETGVDHGVGSCVLASALLRNALDGVSGNYYGTDIRLDAGKLFKGIYASTGRILYGDSIESLRKFEGKIDLFVNDSDHSADYEYQEYVTVASKLSNRAIILGDNAHVTDSLSRYSRESSRKFIFFSEKPAGHWYPGAGIGISYSQRDMVE